jgi:NhaP-type Na+/H+ or K+/H+ antiporter
METQILFLGGFGLLILLVAWFPIYFQKLPLTLPILCVVIGFAAVLLIGENQFDPRAYPHTIELLTELAVIVSLTGAGLSIDRVLRWREWANTTRLLSITMPLSIAGIAALAAFYLGLPWETAALLGAVLAPTDPVLASDIRVGPPQRGPEDEVRFSLTSEAGLNDGLAFPFTMLAIGIAAHGASWGPWTWEWLAIDVVWKIFAGLGAGWLSGKLLGKIVETARERISGSGQDFAALGITFFSYAGAELIHGYGFIAVFVAALVLRRHDDHPEYNNRLHSFTEQAEHLLTMILLVLFGASLTGPVLDGLTWEIGIATMVVLFVIRPLAGMIGLLGSRMFRCERMIVSFFGIRGVGSFYYLAYAGNTTDFRQIDTAWTIVSFIVLVSIFSFGLSSAPLMGWMDRRREAEAGPSKTSSLR